MTTGMPVASIATDAGAAASSPLPPSAPIAAAPESATAALAPLAARLHLSSMQRLAVLVVSVSIGIAALKLGRDFISPVVVGIVAALSLSPIVRRLSGWMPRWVAATIVVTTLTGGIGAVAWALSDEAVALVDRLPVAARELRQAVQSASSTRTGPLSRIDAAMRELQQASGEVEVNRGVTPVTIVDPAPGGQRQLIAAASQAGFIAGQVVLVVFLVYFLLASGDLFKRKFVRLSGDRLSDRKLAVQVIDDIVARTTSVLLQTAFVSVIVGVATWLSFWWLGVRYAAFWGIAAGVLNAMPYIGPLAVTAGSFVAALLQFHSPGQAALVSGVSLAITSLEGMVLSPMLFGRMSRVNPVAVFLSFLFWNWLWGPVGVILAVPLLMILKTIADHVPPMQGLSELLGD